MTHPTLKGLGKRSRLRVKFRMKLTTVDLLLLCTNMSGDAAHGNGSVNDCIKKFKIKLMNVEYDSIVMKAT